MSRTALLLTLGLLGACAPGSTQAPPVLGQVADFQLTDQDGKPFTLADMKGSPWIVDFFFTSCPSICPLLTASMKKVADQLADQPDIRFLSVTVDPETDTPERLEAYAKEFELPQERWRLVTGPRKDIVDLALHSFRVALGDAVKENGDISHSSRLILVDRQGRVRDYFDGLDERAQPLLIQAAHAVAAEKD